MPVFDRQKACEALGGDEELLNEMLGLFLAGLDDYLAPLNQAIANDDAQTTAQLAHRIKATTGTLEAQSLSELAKRLELAGKTNESGWQIMARELLSGLQQLADEIRAMTNK